MKFFKYLLLSGLGLSGFIGFGQQDNLVGSTHTFSSEIYQQERTVQVYTPESYENSEKKYPVLYLLDGQRWFLQGVSYQQLFSEYGYTPDFIVVGINTEDSPRFRFFAQRDNLTSFLKNELIPYIDNNFRTSSERLLFGWQFAGSFALSTLDKNPELFQAYFAASPIPINTGIIDPTDWDTNRNAHLFIANGSRETQVNEGIDQLITSLEGNPANELAWDRKTMTHEEISSFGHRTSPLGALYHGLRFYYNDYPLLEFDDLEVFEQAGGVDYVYKYYQDRGAKYGLATEIPQEGMFFLARLGLDTQHFPTFSVFMNDFIEKGFVETVNLGWGSRYAEFYLSNKDFEHAKKVYEILSSRFTENARPVNGLGDVYYQNGESNKAEEYYKKAIELATKNGDRNLADYQKDLQNLLSEKDPD